MDRDGGTVYVQVGDAACLPAAVVFSRVERNIRHDLHRGCNMATCGLQLIRKGSGTMATCGLQPINRKCIEKTESKQASTI